MVKKVVEFDNSSTKKEAHFYCQLGWHPTPGKPKSKMPLHGKDWNKLDHNGYDEIIEQFNKLDNQPYNLGLFKTKKRRYSHALFIRN